MIGRLPAACRIYELRMNLRFTIFDQTNLVCDKRKVKRELITGRIYLVTGRVLATVGEHAKKVKMQIAKSKCKMNGKFCHLTLHFAI